MLTEQQKRRVDKYKDDLLNGTIDDLHFVAWTIGALSDKKEFKDLIEYLTDKNRCATIKM